MNQTNQKKETTLSKGDLIDIAHGSALLSAGGGGTLSDALDMVNTGFPDAATVPLVSVDAAARAPGLTAACSFVGSETSGEGIKDPMAVGYALERFGSLARARYGDSIRRLVPVDLGSQASVIPALIIGQRHGLAVVDADGGGRAVPGIMVTTFALSGPSPNPAVAANPDGSATVVIEADTALDCHMCINGVCLAQIFGVAGVAMWAMRGEVVRRTLTISGTISLSLQVGQTMRTSQNPVDDVVALLGANGVWARVVAKGTIAEVQQVKQDYLRVTIQGTGAKPTVLWTAGENIIAFGPDGQLIGRSPDALCWLTPDGQTLSNTQLSAAVKKEVALVGVAARPPMRDPRIIELYDYFLDQAGCKFKYTPIEQLTG